ncbi:hypothetical protein PILCRDRAFT_16087 [Piloderma croceum F 1598]|uniref:Uncharacterized protein n=1 Tax=Piloderma croceum (strain F 1598) TaxID=765440 RepID=A0A0C3B5F4_PILCF|nr:hypothetical protein PILCRDRAFT_16087 [Piloderma croceum F 1598]
MTHPVPSAPTSGRLDKEGPLTSDAYIAAVTGSVEIKKRNPPIGGSCTLKVPKWPLRVESERRNLPIRGFCTFGVPKQPLGVESERRNPPIGGSCTLKVPKRPLRVESERRNLPIGGFSLSERPNSLSVWRARGGTPQSGAHALSSAQTASPD